MERKERDLDHRWLLRHLGSDALFLRHGRLQKKQFEGGNQSSRRMESVKARVTVILRIKSGIQ